MRHRSHFIFLITGAAAISPHAMAQETTAYQYDALGRLINVARSGGPANNVASAYSYDNAGNRTQVTTTGATPTPTPTPTPTCTIQATDRSYTYVSGYYTSNTFYIFSTVGNCSGVVVNYSTQNGTALSGTNYTAKSGSITLNSNPNYQGIQIDNIGVGDSNGRYFYINISTTSAGASISDSQAEISLISD